LTTTPDNLSVPIYKRDSVGKIRTWQYEFEGDSYRTIAGIDGGNLVKSGWTKCQPKNEGRANATTAEQQAQSEAVAEEGKKLKREYRRTIAELDSVPVGPMLAQDYAKLKKPLVFPVFSQPKLDGIRAIINRHGAFSRELQPHYNCDHILAALAPVFEKYPDISFDGEFYNHDLKDDFNKIVSVVRKQKPTAEQKAEAAKLLQYHIYDMPSEKPFGQRAVEMLRILSETGALNESAIQLVTTTEATNQLALDTLNGLYTQDGYEGQMVRLDAPYDFDVRSKALLKRKEFASEEFPINFIEEGLGNWAGCAKRIVIQLPDGQECGAGMRGTQEFAKELLVKERSGNRPKVATVRYFGKTPDGMLRFPVVTDFHQEGRVD
jgi:ATP-dependent DNA ligase